MGEERRHGLVSNRGVDDDQKERRKQLLPATDGPQRRTSATAASVVQCSSTILRFLYLFGPISFFSVCFGFLENILPLMKISQCGQERFFGRLVAGT